MFYKFDQNDSYGYFKVDDKVCHRLFIEADSEDEAVSKAEELGCYWNGVYDGIDCPCCGDRWSKDFVHPVPLDKYNAEGYTVSEYDGVYEKAETKWQEKYGKYEIVKEPEWENRYTFRSYTGAIRFRNIEEYAQFLADEYGWTVPDARIFYKDGAVKEVFSVERE